MRVLQRGRELKEGGWWSENAIVYNSTRDPTARMLLLRPRISSKQRHGFSPTSRTQNQYAETEVYSNVGGTGPFSEE